MSPPRLLDYMMVSDMPCFVPGLTHSDYSGRHSEPESATHSRERRRVAVIVRELTSYIDERFNQLSSKLDIATAGLVAIANKELRNIDPQPDE